MQALTYLVQVAWRCFSSASDVRVGGGDARSGSDGDAARESGEDERSGESETILKVNIDILPHKLPWF